MEMPVITATRIEYLSYTPDKRTMSQGCTPAAKIILVPPYVLNFADPEQYIEAMGKIEIIKESPKGIIIDEKASLEERTRILERSPRIMCFGCINTLFVKNPENGADIYERWDSRRIKPFSKEDYVLGLPAAAAYLGYTQKRVSQAVAERNLLSYTAEGDKNRFKRLVQNHPVFLLKDLNKIRKAS
ncbi:MAG: hypothetical protein KKE20_06665 [Nanoarchaeota archaeon]|nr:hypothetical protein [Nanoarchaeota archaeon]